MDIAAYFTWYYALAAAFVVGGLVSIVAAWRIHRLSEESKLWPCVTGKVVECSITQTESSSDPTQSMTLYSPAVEYEYQVDGETLRGKRIKFGGLEKYTVIEDAQRAAAAYPVGAQVQVFYDPALSSRCVLDQTVSMTGLVILFVMGILFVITGGTIFIMSPQQPSQPAAQAAVGFPRHLVMS